MDLYTPPAFTIRNPGQTDALLEFTTASGTIITASLPPGVSIRFAVREPARASGGARRPLPQRGWRQDRTWFGEPRRRYRRGTPEHAAEVARLDAELEEYMHRGEAGADACGDARREERADRRAAAEERMDWLAASTPKADARNEVGVGSLPLPASPRQDPQ